MAKVKRKRLSKISRIKAKAKKEALLPKVVTTDFFSCSLTPVIRQRQNIVVIDTDNFTSVPSCSHGPCLLFSDGSNRKWFSCAVFRSTKDCNFIVGVNEDDTLQNYEKIPRITTLSFNEYGSIAESFNMIKKIKKSEPFMCKECFKYVSVPHKHPVDGPFSKFIAPCEILPAIENTKGEAQFWFSGDTLQVVKDALIKEEIDSVLCVGTPTVFEYLADSYKCFLLDYDDRLALFYSNDQFARYSMLTNYFFLNKSKEKLLQFFASAKKVTIVCDPPFGVFIAALMKSLFQLKEMFLSSFNKRNDNDCKLIVFLPIFVAKHVLRMDPAFSTVDFKVTYKNHRDFSNGEKSIVRIVTNITNKSFVLPSKLGYKFCTPCDRYVAEANSHCKICKSCTSKDGSKFVHCKMCKKCVKATYFHCEACTFCHLRNRCVKSAR